MDEEIAIVALAALAQHTRLETFRLLVRHEPDGLAAGDIAKSLAVPQNTMSAHLSILARSKLIIGDRKSRSIIYHANLEQFRQLTFFLLKDCCGEKAEVCLPILADIKPCC